MKIKVKHLTKEILWFRTIIFLLYIKFTFSYLGVERNYWTRFLTPNVEKYNPLGLSQDFSTKIEYLLIPLLVTYVLLNYKRLMNLKFTFQIGVFLIILNIITSYLNGISLIKSIEFSLKILSPVFLFFVLVIYSRKHGVSYYKMVLNFVRYCLFLVIIGLIFFNPSVNRIEPQLPIFFNNIHTHSYILTSIFIWIAYIIYKKNKMITLLVFYIFSFGFLYFGYAVRTALLLYLIFIMASLFIKNDFFKYLWLQLVIFVPLLAAFVILLTDTDLDSVSSGRITMYREKYDLIKSYNISEFLFGRGRGSDLIKTDKWQWEKKGSHSDLITYTIENGILYLLGFISLIISFVPRKRHLNLIFLAITFGYFFTSTISNGICVRPLAGYIFFMVMAFIYLNLFEQPKTHSNQTINE